MRLQGKTYGEIRSLLGVPKSTQSSWFKQLTLSGNASTILKRKQGDNLKFFKQFNKARTVFIKDENEAVRKTYRAKVGKLSDRELMLVSAALYWAEGQKVFNNKRGGYPYLCFSNSDPQMLLLFLEFLERLLSVSRKEVRCEVHIQPNLSGAKSLAYWHRTIGIPINRLRVYKVISRSSNQKRPKNILPYGTVHIRVNGRRKFFKVKGIIDGLAINNYKTKRD